MNRRQKTEEILDAFAAEPTHNRETLGQYLSTYPELRLELLEIVAEIRSVSDEALFVSEPVEDRGLDDAWSLFTSAGTARQGAIDPFRNATGKRFAELCRGLGLPRGFVVAIRDRRVQLESIPERFLVAAAKRMETTLDDLNSYLSGTPSVVSTAEFKADTKPAAVEQITFKQLIEDTELSDEQRKTALEYLEDDRPD